MDKKQLYKDVIAKWKWIKDNWDNGLFPYEKMANDLPQLINYVAYDAFCEKYYVKGTNRQCISKNALYLK
jgi:hypothetical protein